jgi:hypothetical protein
MTVKEFTITIGPHGTLTYSEMVTTRPGDSFKEK